MTKLELSELMEKPDGLVRVSTKLLPKRGRFFFVKLTDSREEFKAGAYALCNLLAKPKDGDRILVSRGEGASMAVMRLRRTEKGWTCAPLGRSPLTPIFITKLDDAVLAKVERIFDV